MSETEPTPYAIAIFAWAVMFVACVVVATAWAVGRVTRPRSAAPAGRPADPPAKSPGRAGLVVACGVVIGAVAGGLVMAQGGPWPERLALGIIVLAVCGTIAGVVARLARGRTGDTDCH